MKGFLPPLYFSYLGKFFFPPSEAGTVVKWKMEAGFCVAILTCLLFRVSESFQIVHVQKQQCLFENKIVAVGFCNGTSRNQQWMWTEDGKLLHVRSARCLGISNSTGGPSQPAVFAHCSQAPRWTCHEKEGFLQVENTSLFLKKEGFKVVVRRGRKYLHSWMKIDVNKEGKPVNESLCLKKGELFLSESVLKVLLNVLFFTFKGSPHAPTDSYGSFIS
nr:PREDICTED: uncharacterized protein LOC103564964 [Equus przewalskii]